MYYTYHRSDPEAPTIVLIHGFISSQKYWGKLTPFLINHGYNILMIDLLGFGEARRRKTTTYTYETQATHVLKCIEEAKISGKVTLVGHSMGALIAAYIAKAYPKAVKQLIMLHPPLYLSPSQAIDELLATGIHYRFLIRSRARSFGWGSLKLLPNRIAAHSGHARDTSLQNVILAKDNAGLLTKPQVRALLVIGTQDRAVYLKNYRELDQTSKNLSTKIIESDHHSPRKQPVAVARLITGFVK